MTEFECPACGCSEVRYAQPLGSLIHACCRACGMVYSVEGDDTVLDDDHEPDIDEAQEWHDFDPDC